MKIIYGGRLPDELVQERKVNITVRLRDYGYTPSWPIGLANVQNTVTDNTFTVPSFSSIKFIDSINTPGIVVDGTSSGVILWNPYEKAPVSLRKVPTLRRYNPPKFTKRKPREPELLVFVARLNESEEESRIRSIRYEDENLERQKRYRARLNNWESKYKTYLLKKEFYDASYSRSVQRFKRKLNLFLEFRYKFNRGGMQRQKGFRRYTTDNLYSLFEVKAPIRVRNRMTLIYNSIGSEFLGHYTTDEGYSSTLPSAYTTASLIDSISHLSVRFDDQLKLQAFRKLSKDAIDGGVMIGESRETAQLLISIASFLRHLKLGSLAKSLRPSLLKDVNDLYLALKFGVNPLIEDLKKASELLGLTGKSAGVIKVKVGIIRPLDREFFPGLGGMTISGQVNITRTYYYTVENPLYRILSSVGLLNPAAIAWELVPLSFVFDWFYNIGDFLERQTADTGLTPLKAWETIDVRGTASMGAVAGFHSELSTFQSFPLIEYTRTDQRVLSFDNAPVRIKVRRLISTDLSPELPRLKLGEWPLSKLLTSFSLILQRILK